MKSGNAVILAVTLVIAVLVVGAGLMTGWDYDFSTVATPGTGGDGDGQVDFRKGVSSTLNLNMYDAQADSETQVYPNTIWILDANGNKIVNGVATNSTTVAKGDTVTIYVGGSDYYLGEAIEYTVKQEVDYVSFDVNDISAVDNYTTSVFDDNNNELTAEGNNTADYNITMGSDAVETVEVKLKNDGADQLIAVGAFCTASEFNTTGVDSWEVKESGWTEVDVPDELDDASISLMTGAGATYTSGYDKCYAPSEDIKLEEYQSIRILTAVTAGNTNPEGDGGNFVCGLFVDESFEDASDGTIKMGFFKDDDDEKVSDVGIDDTISSPQGLQNGVCIELE